MATGKYIPTEIELRLVDTYAVFYTYWPAELNTGKIISFTPQKIEVQWIEPSGRHSIRSKRVFRGMFVAAFDTFEAAREAADGYRDAYKLGTAAVEQAKAKLAEAQGWRNTSATEAAQRGGLPRSGVAS